MENCGNSIDVQGTNYSKDERWAREELDKITS